LEGTITEYLAALRINPNLVEGHNNLAIALRMKGDLAGAIAEFRAMLSINPNNANAHSELGATLISYDLKRQYAVRWHQAMNGRAEILCRRGAIPLSSPQGRTMKRYGEEVTISAYVVRRALRGKSY
jgi:tetratricopeptide (TPR) repeat protein